MILKSFIRFVILLGSVWLPFSFAGSDELQRQLDSVYKERTANPSQAKQVLEKIRLHFDELTPQQQHYWQYLNAYLIAITGAYDEAIALVSPLISSPYPAEKTRAHLLLANILEAKKNFDEAYTHLYSALQQLNRLTDKELISNIYTVAAQLHISAGAYAKAISFARSMEQIALSERQLCIALSQRLHADIRLSHNYEQLLSQQALASCKAANEPLLTYTLALFLAEVDVQRTPEKLLEPLSTLVRELEQIGFPPAILQSRFLLSQAYLGVQDFAHAQPVLELVQQQAAQQNNVEIGNKALFFLAELYQSRGDSELALQAYRQHSALQLAYFDDYKARNIAYHQAQTNLLESENTLALLKNQNELLRLEREVQTNEKLVAIFAGVSLVTLLLLALYVVNGKRRALHRLATTDYLTHLLNRRHFTELVSSQLQSRRLAEQQSLIMLDIDHFKLLNDQYGHASGDYVLRQVAKLCQSALRKQDVLARMGGEEFAIFLPGCDAEHALKLAENCRCRIAERQFKLKGKAVQVTASFGVATALPGQSFDQLLQQADEALYMAKAAGRNTCYLCQHEISALASTL